MLRSFFSKSASIGYKLFFPDQEKLAKKYEQAFNSYVLPLEKGLDSALEKALYLPIEQGLGRILNYFFPPTHIPPELRGLSGEAYTEAKKALDGDFCTFPPKGKIRIC